MPPHTYQQQIINNSARPHTPILFTVFMFFVNFKQEQGVTKERALRARGQINHTTPIPPTKQSTFNQYSFNKYKIKNHNSLIIKINKNFIILDKLIGYFVSLPRR